MNSYLKLSSTKKNKNCNCISPFYLHNISGINPNTGHEYNDDDKDILKTSLYRISNARGCDVSVCCDPNDPTSMPDANFTSQFIQKFPKIMPMYEGSNLISIKLSTTDNVKQSGWQKPNTHMICKITKATIIDTEDPTIKIAKNLVNDCYTDQCNQAETITINNLLQNAKGDMSYTSIDDARVSQAIREGNITYVKEYIRKYKQVNSPLTNDDYNNRMIHIASESKSLEILNMLIALKANLNITNKLKETPIHFAVRSKNLANMDALLTQGVDLTTTTVNNETAMFYAMKSGDMRIINMLYNNSAPILGLDKLGNNLIHYCILNCPTYKDTDDDTKTAANSIPNTKSEIIKFLIDHGVSSEQKNLAGFTPLELTSKQLNKEKNRECALGIAKEDDTIKEAFFNNSSKNKNNNNNILESFSNSGATKNKISNYTDEHKSLLEIQTMLFNNVITNNPNKYKGYISVDEIPKGAPIEILDTVCFGDGMTGNEDSEDCIAKGGQIVKIKNKTTKIKLELTQANDIDINAVDDKDLYFKKNMEKIPRNSIPINIKQYNDNLSNLPIVPNPTNTTGITYNIGQESTNTLDENELEFNPQPTKLSSPVPTIATTVISNESLPTNESAEHPPNFDENDDVLRKCKQDAIRNSIKITEAQTTQPQTTEPQKLKKFIDKYKIPLIILSIFIILLIIYIVINKFYLTPTQI